MAEALTPEELRALAIAESRGELTPEESAEFRAYRAEQSGTAASPASEPALGTRLRAMTPTNPMTWATDLTLSYTPQIVKDIGTESALPTAGSAIGAGVGALGGPFAPVTVPLGGAVGGMGGEVINQALGITPPSRAQIIASGAADPASRLLMRGGAAALRFGSRHAPGVGGALHQFASEAVQRIPDIVKPPEAAKALWARLKAVNPPPFHMPEFATEVADALQDALTGLRGSRPVSSVVRRLKDFQDELTQYGNTVPFDIINRSRSQIGAWTRSTDENLRNLGMRLYGPIMRDFEAMAASGGLPQRVMNLLRPAIKATYSEVTEKKLRQIVRRGLTRSSQTGNKKVQVGAIWKAIEDDPEVWKRLSPAERKDIKSLLNQLTGLPAELPPSGVQFGSGPSVRAGAVGATAGTALGLDWAGSGTLATGAMFLPDAISALVSTGPGRAVLRRAINATGGQLTQQSVMAALQAARQEVPLPED